MKKIEARMEAALYCASKGLAVFPVYGVTAGKCGCKEGKDCPNPGKHPRIKAWQKAATTAPNKIKEWWTIWPNSNIGVVTGAKSKVVVVDVDGDEGKAFLKDKPLPLTPVVKTKRGWHYYFNCPNMPLLNKVKVMPQIDVRGEGGFVVAAGSEHVSGEIYSWTTGLSPDDVTFAEVPGWLSATINPQHPGVRPGEPIAKIDSLHEGVRNDTLFRIACSMRRLGLSEDAIVKGLRTLNQALCLEPLDPRGVERTARSAARYEAGSTTTGASRGLDGGGGDRPFQPREIAELVRELQEKGELDENWIWEGFIAPGTLVVLAGDPKEGKTTFVAHLMAAVAKEESFLERPVRRVPILWLGLDERQKDTLGRFQCLGTPPGIFFWPGPFRAEPGNLESLTRWLKGKKEAIVVIDTFIKFLPEGDENSSVDINRALAPLLNMARGMDVAVFLLHHTRKAGGEGHKGVRGSNAISADADVIMVLQRKGNAVTLEIESRLPDTPSRLVAELVNGKFKLCPSDESPEIAERKGFDARVLGVLTYKWQPAAQIIAEVEAPDSTVRRVLDRLVTRGLAECEKIGKGKKFRLKHSGTGGCAEVHRWAEEV